MNLNKFDWKKYFYLQNFKEKCNLIPHNLINDMSIVSKIKNIYFNITENITLYKIFFLFFTERLWEFMVKSNYWFFLW